MGGTSESKPLKVAALPSFRRAGLRAGRSKSFLPDCPSSLSKTRFFHIATQSHWEEGKDEGRKFKRT